MLVDLRNSLIASGCAVACTAAACTNTAWVASTPEPGWFPLVSFEHAADVVYSPQDFKVVHIAARDLAADIERVTGRKPSLKTNLAYAGQYAVVIATLEKSPIANDLMRARAFDSAHIRGQWESFVITTVTNPSQKIAHALLIIGSDRRGTAFGVYELARAIGVSPWYWWADVTPTPKRAIYVAPGTRKFGPPSVKYRGIFINDEDWGLHLWAANTFEPEAGGIGPKTYARVFELLLRLKANTLWPAMHACTKPFNHFPENKHLADDYAIVIGSSHAEPMLRNNVSEWRDPPESFNYATNRERVLKYWEERVIENGKFENIYTLGMRGIHDSPMQGARTIQDRLRLIEQIVADQRGLLAKHVNRQLEAVPQVFCAYKEVLELYRAGLNLPEDVTIMWPDDNFGYICHFATMSERKRKGGFGVYYHISYLGRPLAYLWLCTTPPALIWEEMTKAYAHGADRVWIVNVGDIKPAEICTEFFLELAWDVNRWTRTNLTQFLEQWAAREFGSDLAHDIADVMAKYYQLNYQRKPEHLQWWLPGEPPRPSPFTASERIQRLTNFDALQARAERLNNLLAPEKRDAFFQLVLYPVKASALANARYFHGEMYALAAAAGRPEEARAAADMAISADIQLRALTRRFNEEIAGGKWRGLMNLEPADHQWRSMRIAAWTLPKFELTNAPSPTTHTNLGPTKANERQPAPGFSGFVERNGVVSIEAEHFTSNQPGKHGAWEIIPGLGRSGDSVAVFPTTAASTPIERLRTDAPRLGYTVWFGSTGEVTVHIYLVPTHPIPPRNKLRLAIGINAEPPQLIELEVKVGSRTWAQSVLDAARIGSVKLDVPRPGPHTLRVYGVDPGVVVDKIVIDCGGMEPSYLGPTETFTGNQPDR